MLTRRAVILAKAETSYGGDLTPTPAANAILAYSPKITPVPEKITRDPALATLSKLNPLVGKRYVDFTFSTDLHGSGTASTEPRFAPLLASAGFLADINGSVVFAPVSASLKSCSIYAYFDGLLHKILGAVVTNLEIVLAAGGIGKLNWTVRGLYAEPTDAAVPEDAVYDDTVPAIIESSAFTLDPAVTSYVINQLSIVIANDVALRGDVRSAAGVKGFQITGRNVTGSMDPEAMTKATVNIWSLWVAGTSKALSIVIGATAGNIFTITAPAVSLDNIDSGDREGIRTFEIPLSFGLSSGDDEIVIAHS